MLADLTLIVLVCATFYAAWLRGRPGPRRHVLILFLLAAVSTFYPNYLRTPLLRIHPRELLLLALLVLLVPEILAGRRHMRVRGSAMAGMVFFVLASLSAVVGWLDGSNAPLRILRDFIPLVFVALGLLVPVVIATREDLTTLVDLLATFCVLVLALTPIQLLLAAKDIILLPGFRSTHGIALLGWSWAGLALANAFVFVQLYRVSVGPAPRGGRLLGLALALLGAFFVAIGLARMNWIALIVAIAVSLALVPFRVKLRVAGAMLFAAAGIVLLFIGLVVGAPVMAEKALTRVGFLASTTLDASQYRSTTESGERTSIGRRLMENEVAWRVFATSPFLGVGLGYKFWEGVDLYTSRGDRVSLRHIQIRGGAYIHNSWFWLLSKTGLPATLAFAVFTLTPFVGGLTRLGLLSNVSDQAVVFGFSVRGIALLVESIAHPYLFTIAMATGIGLMAGIVSVMVARSREGPADAASVDHHPVLQRRGWHSLARDPLAAGHG